MLFLTPHSDKIAAVFVSGRQHVFQRITCQQKTNLRRHRLSRQATLKSRAIQSK